MSKQNVYADGSCVNNGLPGAKGGYGVYFGAGHPQNSSGPVRGSDTCTGAEFKAVDKALSQASKAGYHGVTVHTDSATVVNAHKSAGYSGPHADINRSSQAKSADMGASVQHVKGHSGNPGNQAAHSMAHSAAKGGKK